ncbi:MAG: hypothetical protein P1V51_05215 [Deltaproteobacteria bacterium]|nr:hypothetical protein [Deltaproteobacteria bacterium]
MDLGGYAGWAHLTIPTSDELFVADSQHSFRDLGDRWGADVGWGISDPGIRRVEVCDPEGKDFRVVSIMFSEGVDYGDQDPESLIEMLSPGLDRVSCSTSWANTSGTGTAEFVGGGPGMGLDCPGRPEIAALRVIGSFTTPGGLELAQPVQGEVWEFDEGVGMGLCEVYLPPRGEGAAPSAVPIVAKGGCDSTGGGVATPGWALILWVLLWIEIKNRTRK